MGAYCQHSQLGLSASSVSQLVLVSVEVGKLLLHAILFWVISFVQGIRDMWFSLVHQHGMRKSNYKLAQEATGSPPRQLLQIIASYLEPGDVAAARLVCRDWNSNLSAQVKAVQLPPHLWQYSEPGQLVQLYRLLDVFKHLQDVRLSVVANKPCDSWSLSRAMDTFRAQLPTLHSLELVSIMQPGHWRAILCSMQCLSQQLTSLTLDNICWPPPETLHVIVKFTALQHLVIKSPHFSRLEQQHLLAIGSLTQLRDLSLHFRTVDGTISNPLLLNPLSALVKLTCLDVKYLGLLELASAVQFCSPRALASLQSLVRLSVSLVPCPCLSSLQRLQGLRHLDLQQTQPLTTAQCCSLASCQQLRRLTVGSLQWADIPKLAPMSQLLHLSISLWQPPRGSLPCGSVGQQLLQLRELVSLQSFKLQGQCEVSSDLLKQLACHWAGLTGLDLCCVMPDGTLGVQQFTRLKSLRVQPYKWDVWSSDPPVLLYPALLPASLTALEALDVWCIDEVPMVDCVVSSSCSCSCGSGLKHSSSYRNLAGFWNSMSGVSSNLCSIAGPTASSSSSRSDSSSSGSSGSDCPVDATCMVNCFGSDPAAAAAAAVVLGGVEFPQEKQLPQQQSWNGEGLLLRTPQLQRLVMRSTSPYDRKLHMPDLSCCNQLEHLELHHSQFNQCHLQHIAASCPNTLRSLKLIAADDGARIRASGLTILTRLSALNNLSVHAHERAMNRNVRKAISSMSQLRSLTLLTSPDYPTNFARSLACLTQLTNLMILRVGLGYGALDALRRLGTHVTKALPHCSYEMLTENSDC